MPIDEKGSAFLQVLSASATQENEWQLCLKEEEPERITKKRRFNTFIEKLPATEKPNELVLFIRASVTTDNFLVVEEKKFPERNLLRSVFEMKGVERHERHVFFFTDEYPSELTEYDNEPKYTRFDPSLLKGVTLYRISCNAKDGIPIDKIRAAAKDKPLSAIEFYRKLNLNVGGSQSEMRIAMVPSGKRDNFVEEAEKQKTAGTETNKKDYALLLVADRDEGKEQAMVAKDLKHIKKVCSSMKDTEIIDICKALKDENKEIDKATVGDYIKKRAVKIKNNNNEAIGKIWLFVSAHGSPDSGILLSGSESISIQELVKPLVEELNEITKILVIDACRGEWPPDEKSQSESQCESKLGLLFRNEKESTTDTGNSQDPWDVSGMKNCVTLFGSVPGFQSWENNTGSIVLRAMQKAVKKLRKLKKPEELHAFVQRVQCCIDKNEAKESAESSPGAESLKPNPEHQIQIPEGATSQEDSKEFSQPQNLESDASRLSATSPPMLLRLEMTNESAPVQPKSDGTEGISSKDTIDEAKEVADGIADRDQQASASRANLEISQTHLVTRSSNTSREYVVPKEN